MIRIILLLLSSLFIGGCKSKSTPAPTPTPAPKIIELQPEDKPIVSLIPRADGHEIRLIIDKIPKFINQIEYELLYTAIDDNMEMEKGAGDTLTIDGNKVDKKILLGTASCTNGCKYKYDAGITGGTLSLVLINQNGQITTFETPFNLKTGLEIKKNNNQINLATENYTHPVTNPVNTAYYILTKNFGSGDGQLYSLFQSSSF